MMICNCTRMGNLCTASANRYPGNHTAGIKHVLSKICCNLKIPWQLRVSKPFFSSRE